MPLYISLNSGSVMEVHGELVKSSLGAHSEFSWSPFGTFWDSLTIFRRLKTEIF